MKKALVYVAVAVLLGFAVMMLPLALETGPPTYQPRLRPSFSGETMEGDADFISRSFGLGGQPSNLLPSGLILLAGVVAALSVYALFQRRMLRHSSFCF